MLETSLEEILKVEELSCSFEQDGRTHYLVRDVSFSIAKKKTLAIVGESGSGKTSCALSILRLHPPFSQFKLSGRVYYGEKDILKLSEKELRQIRGAHIAMIFQDPASALNPVFTIGDQIAEMCYVHLNSTQEEAEKITFAMLDKVGLSSVRDPFETYPHELSGGMKQRVMIAMSLVCNPELLIADEPTTALDLTVQKEILELLKQLQREREMSLLIITHDIGVVAEMADDVAVMYASEIVEYGPVNAVFKKPLHPYTQALFSARPTKELRKKHLPVISGMPPSPAKRPTGCPFHPRCPFVMPKCHEGKVPKFYRGDDNRHWAKCWLWENSQDEVKR
jgi:peptide/nickel transport system ATP-binding protein